MKYSCLKYFSYLCIVSNFITSNSNETFSQPKAHESSLCGKVANHEPRAFVLKNMKYVCVEINGVFYDNYSKAGRAIGWSNVTVKKRCLDDNYPNYQIVPYRVDYTEKKCVTCKNARSLSEFSKSSSSRDGFQSRCKSCDKAYNENHKERASKQKKQYRENHKEERKISGKKYRQEHKKELNAIARERRKTDHVYRFSENMSNAIRKSLKSGKNGKHWEDLVGWTAKEGRKRLESLFTEGMSWDNYGFGDDKWNVEHRKSKKEFNITSIDCQGFLDYWSLDNLQPMWQLQNFKKGSKPMHTKYLIKPF